MLAAILAIFGGMVGMQIGTRGAGGRSASAAPELLPANLNLTQLVLDDRCAVSHALDCFQPDAVSKLWFGQVLRALVL